MQSLYRILKWSEKYTKTDMTYLAKGGFWLLVSQTSLFILSFGLIWVFANLLSQELYGQYRFLITVISLLAITSLPGMRTAIVRATAKGTSGVIPAALQTRVHWGFIGSLGALVGALYYFSQSDSSLGWLFVIIALFVPFYQSYEIHDSYLNGLKEFKNFAIVSIVRKCAIVIGTTLAIVLSKDIFIILTVFLSTTVIANLGAWTYCLQKHPLSTQVDAETIRYGKQLSVIGALSAASYQLDKVALWYLAGPAQVAIYTIAIALPQELSGAFRQVGILALPKMANRDKAQVRQSLLRKVFIFFIGSIPFVILYVLSAPLIFSFFLPQYIDSVFFSQTSALLIALAPTVLLLQYFQATMHTKALYVIQFVAPIILIALFSILIPIFGVLGAVLALIGRQLSELVLLLYFFIVDKRT